VAGPVAPWVQPANWAAAVKASVVDRIAALTAVPPPAVNPNYYVLNEVLDPVTATPLRVQIDGKTFEDAVTEIPPRGAVQYWDIVNTTVDTHPMHLHLVQFKVVGRWTLDMARLTADLTAAGFLVPGVTFDKTLVNPMNYVLAALPAVPGEEGFKDTAKANPGELLRVVARWDGAWADCPPGTALNGSPGAGGYDPMKPVCGVPAACVPAAPGAPATAAGCACVADALNPAICATPELALYEPYYQPVTSGPYVWHCHIVDHEDNEMMRPSLVMPLLQ